MASESTCKKRCNSDTAAPDYGTIQVDAPSKSKHSSELFTSSRLDQYGFGIQFIKRFYAIHGYLFNKTVSSSSALFLLLVCIAVLREYVVYQVGLIASGYYSALGEKNQNQFWKHTAKSFGLILAISFINSTTTYIQKMLTATWRVILTETAHRQYFADISSYQLNVKDKKIDNPDQRMTQDVDKFTQTYCEVLPNILVSPFTIGYYCYQGYQRSGWQGPLGCFGFFVVATIINRFAMSPIVNFVVKQEKREGDFRFVHMLVRVHSESIAFQDGYTREYEKANEALSDLVKTQSSHGHLQNFANSSCSLLTF